MNRLASNNPQYRARWSLNQDSISRQGCSIKTTNRSEIEKALIIDITNKKTNFIAMGCQHHTWLPAGMECGNHITMYVGTYFVGIVGDFFTNNLLHRLFKTGGAGASNQLAQKGDTGLIHKTLLSSRTVKTYLLYYGSRSR